MTRQVPRWSTVRDVVRLRPPSRDLTGVRLAAAADVEDLRRLARRRAPRAVFEYADGGAESEVALRRAREAFTRIEFTPSVLRDVSSIDTSTTILGKPAALPIAFAPTGFTRMMHQEGELAVARVAERAGVVHALSTMGTTSPEALAAAAPSGRRWFQLYLWNDRAASRELVARAAAAGYEALILTVDTPVVGARLRDVRNGLTLPPALSWRTLLDGATHPAWWFDLLTTPALEFASLSSFDGTVAELAGRLFDPALSMADLAWLREQWTGPLVVKGILTAQDARAVVDAGADAVLVSNHGGRQLDRAPTPLEQLPRIVEAVGDRAEVYLDGGVRTGADAVAAVCLGARAVFIGRAYLYGLMAAGERGVQRVADILTAELRHTLQLLGVTAVADLGPDRAHLRS
jgi:L-lactate dehydrogenase (cytochrome)